MQIIDLQREAQKLIDAGEMPSLKQVLQAVAEVRQKMEALKKEFQAGAEALKNK
jgi:hypothetical protein